MKGIKCATSGCGNISVGRGLCRKHYMRLKRHGHVLETRPSDWGTREKHPLYKLWHHLVREYSAKDKLDKKWTLDFWLFVSDVGKRPSLSYRFCRKDEELPFGPDNWYWREKMPNTRTESQRKYALDWLKRQKRDDPEFEFKKGLKRCYGITAEQYYEMHKAQSGVCAICKGHETSVCHQTKKIRRLAVDHCHATGKIRGLLCANCNRGLSSFKDSISNLQSSIKYLGGS